MIGPMANRMPTENAAPERTAVSAPALYDGFARKARLLAGALALVIVVAYQPVWHAGFIWDDDRHAPFDKRAPRRSLRVFPLAMK